MNSRPLVVLLLALLPGLTFCNKPNETNTGSVAGKWKVDSVQLRQVVAGHIEYQTIYVPAADYYDFRADRQLYRYWMGIYDTVPYEIAGLNGRTLIKYPGTADTILVLTNRSLVVKNPQGNDSKLFLSR
ncbi:MAG: hypothetical protein U0U70_04465 [Chitinophagaceae bacterium]